MIFYPSRVYLISYDAYLYIVRRSFITVTKEQTYYRENNTLEWIAKNYDKVLPLSDGNSNLAKWITATSARGPARVQWCNGRAGSPARSIIGCNIERSKVEVTPVTVYIRASLMSDACILVRLKVVHSGTGNIDELYQINRVWRPLKDVIIISVMSSLSRTRLISITNETRRPPPASLSPLHSRPAKRDVKKTSISIVHIRELNSTRFHVTRRYETRFSSDRRVRNDVNLLRNENHVQNLKCCTRFETHVTPAVRPVNPVYVARRPKQIADTNARIYTSVRIKGSTAVNGKRPDTGLHSLLLYHHNASAHSALKLRDLRDGIPVKLTDRTPYLQPEVASYQFKNQLVGKQFASPEDALTAFKKSVEKVQDRYREQDRDRNQEHERERS
ncbi:hypothetical protein EVAR_21618_1 [Eumeta japonica]|uniref:Mariner Mos1 transposase n=1 Tax=Eumeta variegata TaxID=151549 RepID=A0A4C1UY64_EUMVA|nr:hypothetical protein EVAR_21618_1 [Eumeta japonica]